MGIYRDNLSATTFLPIIVYAQNSFDLSTTDIAFATVYILLSPINYRDNWGNGKNTRCPLSLVAIQENLSLFRLMPRQSP